MQVGSDNEEPIIFHQHLKTMALDEEKDLDTSQGSGKLSDIFKSDNSFSAEISNGNNITSESPTSVNSMINSVPVSDTPVDKNQSKDMGTDPAHIFDNDLAYELQQSGVNMGSPNVTSWADIPKENKDKENKSSEISNNDTKNDNLKDKTEGRLDETKVDDKSKLRKDRPLSETERNDKQMKKRLEREKNRDEERELVTNIVSPRGPMLSMQALDNIDLGKYRISSVIRRRIFLPKQSK